MPRIDLDYCIRCQLLEDAHNRLLIQHEEAKIQLERTYRELVTIDASLESHEATNHGDEPDAEENDKTSDSEDDA